MAVKTSTDMVKLILKKQYVLEGSEEPSAEDQATTLETFLSRLDLLREDELVWWDDDETPLMAADPLAEYMAFYCPVLPADERMAYAQTSAKGEMDLRGMAAKKSQGAPIEAEYF